MAEIRQIFKVHILASGGVDTKIIDSDRMLVGRSLEADLFLNWKGVSRQHAEISIQDGKIWVTDLGSKGGTLINDQVVEVHQPIQYCPGDPIRFGSMPDVVRVELYQVNSAIEETKDKAPIVEAGGQILSKMGILGPRTEEEANDKAKVIVEKARGRADSIVMKAQWKAENILKRAKEEAEKSRDETDRELKEKSAREEKDFEESLAREKERIQLELEKAREEAKHMLVQAEAESENIREEARQKAQTVVDEAERQADERLTKSHEEILSKKRGAEQEVNDAVAKAYQKAEAEAEQIRNEARRKASEILENAEKEKGERFEKTEKAVAEILSQAHEEKAAWQLEKDKVVQEIEELALKKESFEKETERLQQKTKKNKAECDEYLQDLESLREQKKQALEERVKVEKEISTLRTDLHVYERGLRDQMREKEEISEDMMRIRSEAKEVENLSREKLDWIEESEKRIQAETQQLEEQQEELVSLKRQFEAEKKASEEETEKLRAEALAFKEEVEAEVQKMQEDWTERKEKEEKALTKKTESLTHQAEEQVSRAKGDWEEYEKKVRAELEEEIDDMRKKNEQKIVDLKLKQSAEYKKSLKEIEEREERGRRESVKEVTYRLKGLLLARYKDLENHAEELEEAVHSIVYSALCPDEAPQDDHVKKLLPFDQEQVEKTKRYWKKTGAIATLSLALIGSFFFYSKEIAQWKGEVTQTMKERETASEVFVKKTIEVRKKKREFAPTQDEKFKKSYMQNIVYTKGYREFEKNEKFKDQWILKLNDYMVDQLKLRDNAIVEFIALEAQMVRELSRLRDKINGEREEDGLKRLRDREEEIRKKMLDVVKGEKNYKKVQKFKKKFYVKSLPKIQREIASKEQ